MTVLAVAASSRARERLREALGPGAVVTADRWSALAAMRAEDHAVVVVGPGADLADLLVVVQETSPSSLVIHVTDAVSEALARVGNGVWDVISDELLHEWLPPAVRRAGEHRRLCLAGLVEERSQTLLGVIDPALLPGAVATVARDVTGADEAVFFARGPEGTLVPHHAGASPVPEQLLARRSQRLEREPPPGPVTEAVPDLHAVVVALGRSDRVHGVLWVLRSHGRRAFAPREIDALAAVAATASRAADYLRLVRDLQHRLAAMDATRRRLEDDGRAADVGRLAVDALHALRSPLAYVRTNLREAAAELDPSGAAGRHVHYALEGLARADKAVEDLSRVSQARERVPIEVRQLVEGALSLARPFSRSESVEVSENAVILGNVGRLTQALAEILRNADQADGATRIDLKASRVGDEVSIEIADDGEGIPADLLPRVTEPFFSTRGRAGLGLATCREAIEQAGGTLELWSRRGVGTVVRVQLPGQGIDDELEIAGEIDDGELDEDEVDDEE